MAVYDSFMYVYIVVIKLFVFLVTNERSGYRFGVRLDTALCGKVFNSRMQFYKHKKTMHCGQPRHTCQFCSKGFMNKCHMNKHMELCSKGKSRRKIFANESE